MSKRSVHNRRRISRDWNQDRIHQISEVGEYKGSILNLSSRIRLDFDPMTAQKMVDDMFHPLFG